MTVLIAKTKNRRKLKQELFRILAEDDVGAIKRLLVPYAPADIVNHLFSALCSTSERVRWHAVTVFGWVVPAMADDNLESARIIMRRLLWSLNDESGGIGWGAPEAMAEIMARDQRLTREYLHMLLSYAREDGPEIFQDGNFLEMPMLQRGLLWGIGRLCVARRQLLLEAGIAAELRTYLGSADHVVRGLAVWCLTALGDDSARQEVLPLLADDAEVPVYQEDRQWVATVSELAELYLQGGTSQE